MDRFTTREARSGVGRAAFTRRKSFSVLLSVVALLVAACAGGGASQSPTAAATSPSTAAATSAPTAKPLIGFSNILRTGCAFCTDVEKSVTAEVQKAGWDLFAVDNNVDANQILANADAMVTKKVKVYLDFDGGITNYGATIQKMAAANIPIIFIDGPFPDFANPNVYWMGANNGEAGRLLGEYAVDYAKKNWGGKIDAIFAVWQSTWPDETKKRLISAMDVISAFDSKLTMKTITISDAVLEGEKTQAAATAFLNANPRLNHILFITCTNDVAGLAAESALEALGRKGHGVILSMGADSSAQQAIRAGGDFKMSVSFGPEKYGQKLVPLIQQILAGRTPPVITRADAIPVDASNINQLYPKQN
jgi:ribose transport system substrate-binding protein